MLSINRNPFLQEFKLPQLSSSQALQILREDLVHPFTGGNKWRKLKYNLIDLREQNKNTLLTFGGAFSNHLIACASAGNQLGIKTIGIIRGEEVLNPCINYLKEMGMNLLFVSREDYRRKTEFDIQQLWIDVLKEKKIINSYDNLFILPEGGSNQAAVLGTSEMAEQITDKIIFIAAGTGATAAGISKGLKPDQQLHIIPVLKAEKFMSTEIAKLGGDLSKIIFHHDYHFGGYAKTTQELTNFCRDFYLLNQIQLEPVYTGKVFFALQDLLKKGTFPTNTSITAIHTGGIYPFYPY